MSPVTGERNVDRRAVFRTAPETREKELFLHRLRLTAVAVAALALAPAAASANTVFLDAYEGGRDGASGPVKTQRLTDDVPYIATVRGTVSFYGLEIWRRACGQPLRRPIYPSRGRPNGRVGADAAFVFANWRRVCRTVDRPLGAAVFLQVATNRSGRYTDAQLLDGFPTRARRDHTYRFAVRGAGRQAKFRLRDAVTSDNYGRLRIVTRRARPDECSGTRWFRFGFADEAECVVAAGGTPVPPAPVPAPPAP